MQQRGRRLSTRTTSSTEAPGSVREPGAEAFTAAQQVRHRAISWCSVRHFHGARLKTDTAPAQVAAVATGAAIIRERRGLRGCRAAVCYSYSGYSCYTSRH